MPLTQAERQRLYRERLKQNDPEKYQEMQKRNRERIKSNYVKVSLLPKSQQNLRRKTWRKLKKNQKMKVSAMATSNKDKSRSRQKYYQNYNKLRKLVNKQNKRIETMKRKIASLEKKVYRRNLLLKCQKLDNDDDDENQLANIENIEPLTPNSKSDSFLKTLDSVSEEDKKKVKRILLEKNILSEALAEQYANCQSNTERNVIKNLSNRDLVRKYKMRTQIGYCLGLKGRIRVSNKKENTVHKKQSKVIKQFFLQDDVSRASAGKKETKTLNKVKIQKRYLVDSLTNLHKKFKEETGSTICYTTFIRHKPFYIVSPLLTDRDTCVCKIHSNIEFKFTALKRLSVLNGYNQLIDVVKDTVCNINLRECMYNECPTCNNKPAAYDFTETKEQGNVTWLEWVVKKIEYQKNNEIKTSKRVMKQIQAGNVTDLITKFEQELKLYKVHIFNIRHQYNCYKKLKDSLQSNEVVLHCDFSENYTCKMHEEIQAVHFGASQYQITLHTSVVYKKNAKPQSYCTFSDSTDHSPEAIWAHLMPVLSDIKETTPEVDTLHVYSDGPSTQYKQKKNFYLFSKIPQELSYKATWNFSESYHGKGAADGVGGTIKRLLDKKVSHGSDVLNANVALAMLKDETSVKLYCINEEDIEYIKENNDSALNCLTAIPKTMKIHQIQSTYISGEVNYRILSCFCESSDTKGFCNCFSLKKHCLIMPNKKNKSQKRLLPETTDEENITLLNTDHFIVTARSDENTSTSTDSIKLPSMRKRQIIMSSDDDEDIFTSQKKIKTIADNNLLPQSERLALVIPVQPTTGLTDSPTTVYDKKFSKLKRKTILSSDDDEDIFTSQKKIKTIADNNLLPQSERLALVIPVQPTTGLTDSPTTVYDKKFSKLKRKTILSSDDEEIFATPMKKPLTADPLISKREEFASTSNIQIATAVTDDPTEKTTFSKSSKLDARSIFIKKLSPAKNVGADDGEYPECVPRAAASSSKICVLSNVKVNYRINDKPKMLSNTARYNISSPDLKTDFKELFTSTSKTSAKKHVKVKQEFLPPKNTDGPIIIQQDVLPQQPRKISIFFNTSSDEEN